MKLLVSARDAGSAGHIGAIVRYARGQERCSLAVYADDTAHTFLKEVHAATRRGMISHVIAPTASDRDRLVTAAAELIGWESPDAILVGVSHQNEAGIDEALLSAAGDIPTFAMQDYWGDANPALGKLAKVYFTIDDEAAAITFARHGATSISVGSPKHESYAALEPLAVRASWRNANCNDGAFVVGVFGQDLLRFEGYRRTLRVLASSVRRTFGDPLVIYRPHPRESDHSRSESLRILSSEGLPVLYADHGVTEHWLMISDLVVSAFSSCNYDAGFLSRFSPAPVAGAAYLLIGSDVREYYAEVSALHVPPPVSLGISALAYEESELRAILERAKTGALTFECWSAAGRLPDPRNASKLIYDTVADEVQRRGGARFSSFV